MQLGIAWHGASGKKSEWDNLSKWVLGRGKGTGNSVVHGQVVHRKQDRMATKRCTSPGLMGKTQAISMVDFPRHQVARVYLFSQSFGDGLNWFHGATMLPLMDAMLHCLLHR